MSRKRRRQTVNSEPYLGMTGQEMGNYEPQQSPSKHFKFSCNSGEFDKGSFDYASNYRTRYQTRPAGSSQAAVHSSYFQAGQSNAHLPDLRLVLDKPQASEQLLGSGEKVITRKHLSKRDEREPPAKRRKYSPSSVAYKEMHNPHLKDLQRLCKKSTSEILREMPLGKFDKILDLLNTDVDETTHLLVRVLCRLALDHKETILRKVNSYFEKVLPPQNFIFMHSVSTCLCSMPLKGCQAERMNFFELLTDILNFFEILLKRLPAIAPFCVPVDACCGAVEQLVSQDIRFQEINEKAQNLKGWRDQIRSWSYESSRGKQKTLEDKTCLPTTEDLESKHLPSTLQENIIEGPYPSPSEYLAIHLKLMREDFIHPLRCALHSIQNEDEQNLCVFEEVQFKSSCMISSQKLNADATYELSFKTSRKMKWERSKRLNYGSLLCLSDNDFDDVLFATVEEREVTELNKGLVTVKLQGVAADDPSCTASSKVYRMLESPCYYEAYAPVLRRLNEIDPKQLPFQKYFVECETKVDLPIYLRNKVVKMNLSGVICDCKQDDCKHECIDITNEDKWQTIKTHMLDSSQKEALQRALTTEVALIQGPPGTGKTFIGLKILQALLLNKSSWKLHHRERNSERMPIVIMCYTNHALDQFLEGLIKIRESCTALKSIALRRLGGRCKSQVVDAYNLKKFINKACRAQNISVHSSKQSYIRFRNRLQLLDDFLEGKFEPNRETISAYSSFITDSILIDLVDACDIFLTLPDDCTLTMWLDYWQLFPKVDQPHPDDSTNYQFEEDRRIDDSEGYSQGPKLDENSLHEFVTRFKIVKELKGERANKLLKSIDDIEGFPRLQLFKYCLHKLKDAWHHSTVDSAKTLAENEEKMELIKLKCLQDADVIGLTTTAAAKYSVALTQVRAKVIIIEEAAEVLESQIIASLTKHTQHLVLIGDHKQLRPKTNDYTIAKRYKLGVSLFERLVKNQFPYVTLKVQHRMNPEISAIVSTTIYNGILKDSVSTSHYKNVQGMKHNVYFVDHCQYETPEWDNSPSNNHEAEFIVCLCKYLTQNGYKHEEITVITPYLGQMFKIRTRLRETGFSELHVNTIDNYQGEENEIILLSLVRSNKENRAGFVKEENRICVALSRAKIGFYCIGNFSLLEKSSKLWKNVIEELKVKGLFGDSLPVQCTTHKKVTEVKCVSDFNKVSEGGCEQRCSIRLPKCNHVCQSKCHPNESKHDNPCTLPCPKLCKEGLHRCKSQCGQRCGDCKDLVDKIIPRCDHNQKVPCYLPPHEFICEKDCQKKLSCGHPCKLKCGKDCQSKPCNFLVKREWPCGHEAQKECHIDVTAYSYMCSFPCGTKLKCDHFCKGKCGQCRQGRLHIPCKEKCTRSLVCGHLCSESCARNCPPCVKQCQFVCPHGPCGHKCSLPCKPCPHRCQWKCKHYQCTKNCDDICDRPRCSKPCPKKLKCGHMCIGLCGEPCPSVCRECDKDSDVFECFFGDEGEPDSHFITLADCGHLLEVKALDKWVDSKKSGDSDCVIKWKECPRCKKPIVRTLRYANVTKGILKDINAIKRKDHQCLTHNLRKEMGEMFQQLPSAILGKLHSCLVDLLPTRLVRSVESKLSSLQKMNKLPEDSLLQNIVPILYSISESMDTVIEMKRICTFTTLTGPQKLKTQMIDFLDWIMDTCFRRMFLTDQMQIDLQREVRRIILLRNFYQFKHKMLHTWHELSDADSKFLEEEIRCYECSGNKPQALNNLTEKKFDTLISSIRDISLSYRVPLSHEERSMIITAMGAKPGSWYKCENGHYYQIGQCGGAMETSRCPECAAVIGGGNHRLAVGNRHASDFDGSGHAAWSEGANMLNYELL